MRHARIPRGGEKAFLLPRYYRFRQGGFSRLQEEFRVPCDVLASCEQAAMVFASCMGMKQVRGKQVGSGSGSGSDPTSLLPTPYSLPREELWVLSMDDACRATAVVQVAVGTEDGVQVEPSLVLRAAELSGCESFVLGHNHPTGDPTPSLADWTATSELLSACDRAGLEFVDHLVLGDGVYVSMRSRNEGLFLGERGLGP